MPYVEVEDPRPHVRVIRLNRPERMNAMSFDVMVPFREAIDAAAADNDVAAIIVTGTGRGFCSGADLEDSSAPPNIAGLTLAGISIRAMEYLSDLVVAMRHADKVVIAAINGAAVGGGMCLSLGADIRIASRSAYFRAAGINNGLTATELGVSFLLPRAIGASRAFEILLSGRDVDAEEAERIGLVSRVVEDDDLLDAAFDLAEKINAYSRVGVALTKQVLWSALEVGSLDAAINLENRTQLHMRLMTKNFEEAIIARREGRPPVFRD
ncbi:MAG: enoyl-CoA hydratase [Acidimicrobiia bacterium]|jgi:enoyl-CoA hydratase